MKKKIQEAMSTILSITLVLSVLLFTSLVYYSSYSTMKSEVYREALYISEGINSGGDLFLHRIMSSPTGSRITLISGTGEVLEDSHHNPDTMENHGNRAEVRQARLIGAGSESRKSETLGARTFYHAIRLEDGRIIRISRTMDNVLATIWSLLPGFTIISAFLYCLAIALSRRATQKLIQPINELDVEAPFENQIYQELTPLLQKIHSNNTEKEEIENMRKEFSANVSHELKTPLTSISGYAELLKNNMVRAEDIPRFAEKIHTEACRLVVLIEDIIRISQLDEQGIQMEKQELDLFVMMREIRSRLSYPAQQKNVQIHLTGSNVSIHGVESVLMEMLYNITENAIKYNKENGTVDIWVGDTLEGPRVIVTDTGIGVPQEDLERIFERFYRVDKSHSKETGGTGLGLSIVKHGARLHHAVIEVDSTLNIGTKVTLNFMK